jgi:excisionase family DNA binding protein
MDTVIVTTEADLRRIIREALREELLLIPGYVNGKDSSGPEALLTRAETAALLRISLVTLTTWVKDGLPAHRKRKGGRVLFEKSEVLRWLRSNRKTNAKSY